MPEIGARPARAARSTRYTCSAGSPAQGCRPAWLAALFSSEIDVDGIAVCLDCVHDAVLREELRPDLGAHQCTFCGAVSDEDDAPVAVDFEQFMRVVMGAVRFLYWTVEDSGMPYDSEDAVYVGGDVLDKATVAHEVCYGDVTDDVLDAITDAITEDEWTPALGTAGPTRPDQRLLYAWKSLCNQLKYRSRFVFLSTHDPAAVHPDAVGAPELLRRLEQIVARHGMRRTVLAGRRFWRGRLTDDSGALVAWANAAQLGSPPRDIASSNRFSPAGISMFYGSDAPDTVVAEIGSHANACIDAATPASPQRREPMLRYVTGSAALLPLTT